MSSWSENRGNDSKTLSLEDKLAHMNLVNKVLKSMAEDSDFQEDLKLPIVMKALDHWTNKKRLPAEEAAQMFEEDRTVISVFNKIKMLQKVCADAQMKLSVPHHQMMNGVSALGENFENEYLGKTTTSAADSDDKKDLVDEEREPKPKSTFDQILLWGKEGPYDPGFSVVKMVIRSSLETIFFTIIFFICYSIYNRYLNPQSLENNINSTTTTDSSAATDL